MKKTSVLLSFDIEEFDLPLEYGTAIDAQQQLDLSIAGTREIIKILDETKRSATFFFTVNMARRAPELVRAIAERGHEIASHGMTHSGFARTDLKTSRLELSELSGQAVSGFRMPRLAKIAPSELTEAGYQYDSSLNPVWLPGRYNHRDKPVRPYYESSGLVQFPVSVTPWVRFPLFWLSFKNVPWGIYSKLAARSLFHYGFFNLYTHPWEYISESADPKWRIPGYVTRGAGPKQRERLRKFLQLWGDSCDFITFSEAVSRMGKK